jgi:hypothetical protein
MKSASIRSVVGQMPSLPAIMGRETKGFPHVGTVGGISSESRVRPAGVLGYRPKKSGKDLIR